MLILFSNLSKEGCTLRSQLVDEIVEGLPFLLGDVCDHQACDQDSVQIHWYPPANKQLLTGKWTPDYASVRPRLVPSVEDRARSNIIPVPLEPLRWTTKGFKRGDGGRLTKFCVANLLEWCEECHEYESKSPPHNESRKRKQPAGVQ